MTASTRTFDTGVRVRRTAQVLWWASVVMALAGVAMTVMSGALEPETAIVLLYLATGSLGAVVALRVPHNSVGWLLVGTGLIAALQTLAAGTADVVLLGERGPHTLGVYAAVFSVALWPLITFIPLIPVLLLFPDGTLPSPRWRVALWVSAVAILGTALGLLVLDDSDGEASDWGISNPLAIDPEVADAFLAVTFMLVIVTLIAAAWSLLLRLRRSRGDERQRIMWVVYGGALAVPMWIVGGALLDQTVAGGLLAAMAMTLIPVSIAVAVLRYRLYDIDRLISRTVSYALVAGLLAGLYAAITVALPQVLPVSLGSPVPVAGATLAAAALFSPLRRYVQARVDRRFNRSRYDAQREMEALTEILRSALGLEEMKSVITGLVVRTMEPSSISLWLEDARVALPAAANGPFARSVPATGPSGPSGGWGIPPTGKESG